MRKLVNPNRSIYNCLNKSNDYIITRLFAPLVAFKIMCDNNSIKCGAQLREHQLTVHPGSI